MNVHQAEAEQHRTTRTPEAGALLIAEMLHNLGYDLAN